MEKRKIAEVVCTFPPYRGGTGKVARDNALLLAKSGALVTVFTPRYFFRSLPRGQEEEEEKYPFFLERVSPLIQSGNAAVIPNILPALNKYDIVHLHCPFLGAAEFIALAKASRFFRPRLFLTYHQDILTEGGFKEKVVDWHNKFILPFIVRQADKIFVSSFDYLKHSVLQSSFEAFPQKFFSLPFGVDTKFFHPLSSPAEKERFWQEKYPFAAGKKVILFVGGLDKPHYFKGLPFFLKMLFRLPAPYRQQFCFLVVGDGDQRFYYEQLAFGYGLKDEVHFLGSLSGSDLAAVYRAADFFVLPSINKGEAFGLVLLEAMASGIPVLASSLPGVRTVVEEGKTGFLLPPQDSRAWQEKVIYLLSQDEARKKMGAQARERAVAVYQQEKIDQKFLNFFYEKNF